MGPIMFLRCDLARNITAGLPDAEWTQCCGVGLWQAKAFHNVCGPESGKESPIPATGTRNGYQWVYLRAHGMEFCAISDVSAADLHNLAESLQE
jgi:hypothetical protein